MARHQSGSRCNGDGYLRKYRPSIKQVLTIACIVCVFSEIIKVFSLLEMVPSSDGSTMHLYLKMQQLPFQLCSVQMIFIFFTRFAKNEKAKEILLAFMSPTCTLGSLFAFAIPTIFINATVDISDAFTHPLAYQYFLYHTMLVLLGVYITASKEVDIRSKHYLSTLGILGCLGFASIYLNSIFAVPTYVNGELISVDYSTNFFFTQTTPIGIALTEKWHWFAYMGIIAALAFVLIGLWYLPYFIKEKHRIQKGMDQ